MASGGGGYSEPRSRQALISRLMNTDEDVTSTVSAPASSTQDRLNNWDFSNWKPNSSFENTKRPKRANEEKGEVRDVQKRRNKENFTVSSESSPQVEATRHKTPSTFPRTKITPVMPMSQRVALENLRQHITFSDMEESVEGGDYGRNNERSVPRRDRPVEMSLERNEVGRTTEPSRDNRNTQRQLEEAAAADAPDSTQIVGRLMQIRGYIKESSSMMEKLQASGDPSDHGRATQLEQVINRLREQEQKYLELLLKLSTAKEDLLERQNSLQGAPGEGGVSQLIESESEAATELEVDTDTSENEDAPEVVAVSRPRIEDKLGLSSDPEHDPISNGFRAGSRTSQPETPELDATLVSEPANVETMSADLLVKRKILETDLSRKNEELYALKEQHDLLRKMLEQQETLKDLQGRQASLMMLQKEAESQLEQETGNPSAAASLAQSANLRQNNELPVSQKVELTTKIENLHESSDRESDKKRHNSQNSSKWDTVTNLSGTGSEDDNVSSVSNQVQENVSEDFEEHIEPVVLTQETEPVMIMQNMILGEGGFPIFPSNFEGQFMFPPDLPRNLSVVLGNSGSNLIVGNSEEQLVMPSHHQHSTVVIREGGGYEGESGDEVVETYKVMYVVEVCEEEEDDEAMSQASCKIMELNDSRDIEDYISDISKPMSPVSENLVMESPRTKAMSPICEAHEEEQLTRDRSDSGVIRLPITPPAADALGLRSDVSEAGSSQAEQMEDEQGDEGEEEMDFGENPDMVPQELKDLRQRLDYLKNLYEQTEQVAEQEEEAGDSESPLVAASDTHRVLSAEKAQLQDKLADLLQQKSQMDQLLGDLQNMKGQTRQVLNNDIDAEGEESALPLHLLTEGGRLVTEAAARGGGMVEQDEEEEENMLQVMEARTKLKKLQEVKDRLNQLKGLVHYYQTGNEFIHGPPDESPQTQPDLGELMAAARQSTKPPRGEMSRSSKQRNIPPPRPQQPPQQQLQQPQQPRPEEPDSETSETGSQMSSDLGAWGDDPVIQDKVRRLKDAKEKLHRLQDLVAMVQSPDGGQHLPEDLAELAASLELEARGVTSGGERELREASLSLAGAVAAGQSQTNTTDSEMQYDQQEEYYQMRMTEQKSELESLMHERKKLLSLQQELQRLHDTIPQPPSIPATLEKKGSKKKGSSPQAKAPPPPPSLDISGALELLNNQDFLQQTSPNNRQLAQQRAAADQAGASGKAPESMGVTFQEPLETVISNEELYGRMRQQRMLREELREKKKELEDMMRKDRPRKQYSRNQDHQRNQDNQSDNISYSNRSTELFGGSASVDQTMATWGGSTVDNLESIEEDEGNSGDGQEADDGYPSDGIVQVEEEEEQVALEDSDDRDTYTIEEEPYIPKSRTPRQRQEASPPGAGEGARTAGKKPRGAPFQGARGKNSYNYWDPDNNQVLNNVRASGSKSRTKKKDKDSELRNELKSLKEQIDGLKETLVTRSTPNLNQDPMMNQNLAYMSSLQQQQMMLSLSQFHNQMMSSQQEMGDRLGRLERSFSTSREFLNHTDLADSARRPYSSHQNSPRDAIPPPLRGSMPHYLDSYAAYNNASNMGRRNNSFEFSPYFPDGFVRPSEENSQQESPIAGGTALRPGGLVNNTNNNHMDALRLESVFNRDIERERNPFRTSPYCSGSLDNFTGRPATADEPDAIPIETIQAQDTREGARRIPRLNLDRLVKEKGKRSESNQPSAFVKDPQPAQVVTPSKPAGVPQQVIGEKFPTPSRASAAARLASQKVDPYRPGVSAGISGAGAQYDTASVSSAVSSEPGGEDKRKATNREADPAADFSLFEALRETIYSEVATLISQNEARPHYLIELFRELQLMGSDYLRQRALYAVQDLASNQLTEDTLPDSKKSSQQQKPTTKHKVQQWSSEAVANELTPSLSAFTSEEEDVKAKLYGQNPRLTSTLRSSQKGQTYDYNENVEDSSFLNTPDSPCFESPFARDSLGDTVIHMDESLQKLADLKQTMQEGEAGGGVGESPALSLGLRTGSLHMAGADRLASQRLAATAAATAGGDGSLGSSAQDNGSEGSVSDVAYPRIDTHHLDQQIKAIMTEIIPVLNEHMDDVCSQQLLSYIKRLVLSLAQHVGGEAQGHEFVRFFNKQLGSILQDSLSKFDGRKMRDCGEDLLVDLSEILFNELAFFRLMQDLDDPKMQALANPPSARQAAASVEEGVSQLTQTVESFPPGAIVVGEDDTPESSGNESDTESSSEIEEREGATEKRDSDKNQNLDSLMSNTEEEEEQLGKARDDEMAAQTQVGREEEEEEEEYGAVNGGVMKIQLAPSETKPMTRIGSDEDDEGEDEDHSYEEPSDTAVSHDYGSYSHDDMAREYSEDTQEPAQELDQPQPLLVNDRTKEEMERYRESEKEVDTTEVLAPPPAVVIDNTVNHVTTSSSPVMVNGETDSEPTDIMIHQSQERSEQLEEREERNHSGDEALDLSGRDTAVDIGDIKVEEVGREETVTTSDFSQADTFQTEASPGAANSTVIEVNGQSCPDQMDLNLDMTSFSLYSVPPKVNKVTENHEDSEEDGGLTLDDLPTKLNVDLLPKTGAGEKSDSPRVDTEPVLQHLEESLGAELVGDPQALKEPDSSAVGTQV